MVIDFFVHPEHAKDWYTKKKIYDSYMDSLKNKLQKSELPIIIKGLRKSPFEDLLPVTNCIKSNSFTNCGGGVSNDYGEVHPNDWDNFVNLIENHKDAEMRVHGSFYGWCVEKFAEQLFAYIHLQEHWKNWKFGFEFNEESFRRELQLKKHHLVKGNFKKSKIKYGKTLFPPKRILLPARKGLNYFYNSIRSYGDLSFQLTDENTTIF